MRYLFIGDLHLTDRPRDAYRFDIFAWIEKQQLLHHPEATFFLGDLADQKDRHSAPFVNKVVESILRLAPPIYILMGNHDYIDPNNPFFRFLSRIEGVTFVTSPRRIKNVAMIPHCRHEEDFEQACHSFKPGIDYLLLHNTFSGAIAETGAPLSGFSTAPIDLLRPALGCYAGDVHKPQKAGPVTYVGAPYTVRFGDDFEPRVILINGGGKPVSLHFDCPRKWKLTVRSAEEILNNKKLLADDQVKITIELAREEAVEWKMHKQTVLNACKEMGLEVFGVALKVNTSKPRKHEIKSKEPADIVAAFCNAENLPSQVRQAGMELLK